MKKQILYSFFKLATISLFIVAVGCSSGGDSEDSSASCPGSIISSCVDFCPENCDDKGLIEVCIGSGFEPNRCCYCE